MEDNNILFYILSALLFAFFFTFLIKLCFGLGRYREQRKADILQATIRERDRTMKAISVEVHDNLNQMLNLASMTMHMVKPFDEQAEQHKRNALDMLRMAIGDANYITRSLNAEYINSRDLRESIRQICEWVNQTKAIRCIQDISGQRFPISKREKLMVIRIVQEAINNVLKHAKAQVLYLKLLYNNEFLKISIIDDGKGFDPEALVLNTGIGIDSMKQRARMIKAELEIDSRIKDGTRINLTLKRSRNS